MLKDEIKKLVEEMLAQECEKQIGLLEVVIYYMHICRVSLGHPMELFTGTWFTRAQKRTRKGGLITWHSFQYRINTCKCTKVFRLSSWILTNVYNIKDAALVSTTSIV